MTVEAPSRGANPFPADGVAPDADGVRRYAGLPGSLVDMLRESVVASPHAEALAQVGGERVSYRELWDRAARVAGGLREQGIAPGDRVAIALPNSIDWMLAFFGGLIGPGPQFAEGASGWLPCRRCSQVPLCLLPLFSGPPIYP